MVLPRLTVAQKFDILQPRWHDNKVLLACHKIGTHNSILFTNAPTLPGEFYISGRDATRCDKESNGRIWCYAVPMRFLEPLEREGVEVPPPRSRKQLRMEV